MSNYKKGLFIYNPMSGNRQISIELDEVVEKFVSHKIIPTVVRLEDELYDDLDKILTDFDYDFVVGAGGDGTINAIAKRLIRNNITKPYAVIGAGTCNNFASNINMKADLYEAIEQIFENKVEKVDVGFIGDDNTFLSSLAVGIFAETSFETNPDLKEWLGPLAYYLQGITKLSNIKANKFIIKTKDKIIEEMAYMILVLNGNNVGSITGILDNKSDIQDGVFELIIIKESPNPIDVANLLVKVARGEDFTNSTNIRVEKSGFFEIDCANKDLGVSLDGEQGPALPLSVEVKSKILNVIVG